ncbi:MAG: malate dehydrogenase [Candidatus Nanohaloarchaeota archaeon QJJ-5]|nr:malate dehydrogenase [Candidatus Nanohaloarchaeota archaeon QJJ-5]
MKLTVIGAGTVGAGTTYNTAIRDVFDEIVLIDLDEEQAKGEALDISHAISFFSDTEVRQGTYEDAVGSDVVAITAGKPRKEGMSRTDLLEANIEIVDAILGHDFADDTVFITTTNPMDVMNYANAELSSLPRERFIGFGGWLDSARFQYVLSQYLDEPADDIRGYVIGEHGDAQVPVFSQVTVDGDRREIPKEDRKDLVQQMRQSAMDVISRKGGTQWAPTYGMSELITTVATDDRRVFPCSAVLDGEYGHSDLSIGVPVVLGSDGIETIIEWDLEPEERKAFDAAVEKLQGYCDDVDTLV